MCGILGEIRDADPVDRRAFARMLATLRSRGPDGEGMEFLRDGRVALGHTRLAIIDLSEAGRQPLANEDESIWTVVNGEIYNYRQLRAQLEKAGHRFRSSCDSEVVLHAYEQWGDSCVHRLRGIFAFGLWDGRRERLLLVRDRLGVKPLYYQPMPGGLVFASQARALLAHPGVRGEIDLPALQHYLAYRYVPGAMAIYEGMRKLPAAHRLVYEHGKVRVDQWWEPVYRPELNDASTAEGRVAEAITEAVELELTSDVPVGIFLSGGIDSSTVAAIAARLGQPLPSFTLGFEEPSADERPYARLATEAIGGRSHEAVFKLDDALATIPTFISVYDEPFFDQSGLPTHRVSALARSHDIKVILSGDGGDELFAGYKWYDRFLANPQQGRFTRVLDRFVGPRDSIARYFSLMGYLDGAEQARLLRGNDGFDHLALLRRHFRSELPPVTALQWMDLHTFLVDDILTKVDHASMANGVEVRVPLLDYRLVETTFSVASDVLFAGGERKALLKNAVRDWLPEEILTARKKGFSVPLGAWMERGLHDIAARLVRDGSLVTRGVFRPEGAQEILERRHPRLTWLLFVAELWARHWIERAPVERLELSS